MSTKAKITLGASVLFCCVSVYGVHYLQRYEKELMASGIARDEERRLKYQQQQQNIKELDEQQALHQALLQTQKVSNRSQSEDSSSNEQP